MTRRTTGGDVVQSAAKTTAPRLSGVLPRKRLFRLLDRGRPLTWIAAPPGAGKTTLVASYLRERALRGVWYQVDRGDADPATCFHYLARAARQAAPRRGAKLPPFAPEHRSDPSLFARRWFEGFYGIFRRPFALVLDDYHEVPDDAALHALLEDALSRLPPDGRILVLSRGGPPPRLARARANGLVTLVEADALRLTGNEALRIARLRRRGTWSRAAILAAVERVQGWAAGLTLVLEEAERGGGTVLPLESTPQLLFDYFASEVLERTPAEVQEVLLRAAFLPWMTAEGARRLTRNPRAGSMLAGLHRRSYFTLRRAGRPEVYDFHPLFREFLVSKARDRFTTGELEALRLAAARQCEAEGAVEVAADLYCEARAWEAAGRAIRESAPDLLRQGRGAQLEAWIARLPEAALREDPWLAYWRGHAWLPLDPEQAYRHFDAAFRVHSTRGDARGSWLAWSGAVRSLCTAHHRLERLEPWLARAKDLDPERLEATLPDAWVEVVTAAVDGMLHRRSDDPRLDAWADRLWRALDGVEDHAQRRLTAMTLMWHWLVCGDPARARRVVDRIDGWANEPGVSPYARLCALWAQARHASMTGQPGRCLALSREALELREASGIGAFGIGFLRDQAFALLVQGELDRAEEIVGRLGAARSNWHGDYAGFHQHHLAGWLALLRGDVDAALDHSDCERACADRVGCLLYQAIARLGAAQVQLARGDLSEAERFLGLAAQAAQGFGGATPKLSLWLLEAELALARGERSRGLASLAAALKLAAEQRCWLPWRFLPRPTARLAATALEAGIEPASARTLIVRRALAPPGERPAPEAWPWPVRIYTLGRFAVLREGEPLRFPSKAQRRPLELLRLLIAHGGQGVAVEPLADALWPDSEGHAAHHALETALYRLRRLLGRDDAVELRDGKLSLGEQVCWLDLWALERVAAQVERAVRGGASEHEIAALGERLLKAYPGAFLGDDAREPTIVSTRERLRGRFLRQVASLVSALEQAHRWDLAIPVCQRGLEVDDLAEDLYRRLAVCYRELGRDAEALATYRRCRKVLTHVLGVEPSAATRDAAGSLGRQRDSRPLR